MARTFVAALAVSLVVAATGALPAGAATAARSLETITFTAAAAEVNDLVVTPATMPITNFAALRFDDTVAVTASPPCVADGDAALCPRDAATSVVITLADQADEVEFAPAYPANLPTTINGDAGIDTLNGSPSVDTINGGTEADSLYGLDNNDALNGGDGIDLLTGGLGNDTLVGGANADSMTGNGGLDTVSYAAATAPVTVTLDALANDGAAGEGDNVGALTNDVENVIGGSAADTLTGQRPSDANPATANTLDGGGGPDVLNGREGGDTLKGGAGDDTLDGGPGDDVHEGGDGARDIVTYADRSVPVSADLQSGAGGATGETDTFATVEDILGGSGNDTLRGSAAENRIDGAAGDDDLYGGPGAVPDVFVGGPGAADEVLYSERTFTVNVTLDGQANDGEGGENDSVGNDVEAITGGSGNDDLGGSVRVDTINGLGGDDVLRLRDAVADVADCGPGNDTAISDDFDNPTACERVERPAKPAPPAAPQSPAPAATPPAATPPRPTPPTPPFTRRRAPRRVLAFVGPRRDRRPPFRYLVSGRIEVPAEWRLFARAICAEGGRVEITARLGRRRVLRRRVAVDRDCGYEATMRLPTRRRLRSAVRVTFTVSYRGNRFLTARAAQRVTARAG